MARRPTRTHRGKLLDMDALLIKHEGTVAVGNANMNARGDILGKGGNVVKTKEQITNDYYQNQVKANVISDESPAVYKAPEPEAEVIADAPKKPKRKVPAKPKKDK